MSLPAHLQTAFSSLQQELEKYIRDEVQRQVSEAMKGGGASAPKHDAPKKFKQPHKPNTPKHSSEIPKQPKVELAPTPPAPKAPTAPADPKVTATVTPEVKSNANPYQTAQRLLQQISARKNLSSARPS